MKTKHKVDTPRKGSWAEHANDPIPERMKPKLPLENAVTVATMTAEEYQKSALRTYPK